MTWGPARRRSGRRSVRWGALGALTVAVAVLVSGCSLLHLDSGPVDASIITSAPPAAGDPTSGEAVTVPTLGATGVAPAPVPWESLTSTSGPPTTSEAPLTAPTTTRTTLTFATLASVTQPTISAPALTGAPPPACYADGSCPSLGSAAAAAGSVLVVNPPGGDDTVAILTVGGKPVDSLPLVRLSGPTVQCAGSHCLVQGSTSGVHFGNLMTVAGGRLRIVPGTPVSTNALRLSGSGASILVTGTQRFLDYGLPVTDSPLGARTWTLAGGKLASTGCSAPRLYAAAPAVTAAQRGPCSGTPRISGYGSASANKIVSLGGFVTASGNIACAVGPGPKLACTAKKHDFTVKTCTRPAKEVPAGLRGLRVLLGKTGGMSYDGCLGYTLVGSPTTAISYNRLAVGGGFVCEVQESGVTCTGPSGRGFALSRSAITSR